MKTFETVFEAVRHIKQNLPDDEHEEIYLMWCEGQSEFHVSDNADELVEQIDSDFYNWGYQDCGPEEHAAEYEIWTYELIENKDMYPVLYRDYKRTPLSKNHIRGQASAIGEITASFAIS